MAGSFAAVVSIGTALVLLAAISFAQAAEIKIVSPSAYQDREGEGSLGEDCCGPYHAQVVFPAEDFAALGNKPHWLVYLTLRPDKSVMSPRTVHWPEFEARLTTMPVGPPNLSLRFDDNLGSSFQHWYRGPMTAVTDVNGPGPGPREFYVFGYPAGVTPYLYDPSQGNLLLDTIARQGNSPSHQRDQIPSMLTALAGSPFDTYGSRGGTSIFQFTFIPVPELSNPVSSGGQFQFTLTGETNVNYIIQTSTNLQSWTPLATNSSPNASRNIAINAPNSRSFYRTVVGP
jgi:hypothetical protein